MRNAIAVLACKLIRAWAAACILLMLTVASAQTPTPAASGAAATDMATWLTQTGAQFDAAYQREVQAPFDAGLETLRKNFLAAVVQAMEKANEARKLDEANVFRLERERFLGAGHKPPEDDSDNPTDGVKALRSVFRTQFAQLDLERFNHAKALYSRCDQSLAQAELTLTQRQRAADATLVKAKRAALAKAWLLPPAQPPGGARAGVTTKPPVPTHTEVTKETIREAVEWVFSVGGTVALPDGKDGKGQREIGDASQLPSGPVTIAHIVLDNGKLSKPVQDADLSPLAGLRNVRFFDSRGNKLTDAAFGFLDGWKELEKFYVNASRVSDAVVARLAHFETLHSIQIRGAPGVTGKGFDKLAGMRNFHSLDLDKSGITDEGLATIAQLKSIDELIIPGTEVTDAGMVHVAAMHGLRKLQIQGTKVTAAGLAPLAALRDLDELGFLTSGLTDYAGAVKQVGATFPKLHSLRFIGGDLRSEQIEPLATLHGLKELHVQSIELGTAAIASIAKLPSIEELGITYSTLGDEQLSALAALKKVRILRLNNTKLTDASLLKLKTMRGLKELEVRTTGVTVAGVTAFEKDLPGCKVIRGN